MGNNKLRKDKTCQNCGTHIEDTFCSKCGQKNTESRRSFYSLFIDFFAGVINYDSSFWRTTRYLFTSPGKLTQEYMAGKRKSYLPPVQLYLLASFIAFFVPTILPDEHKPVTVNTNTDYAPTGEFIKGYGHLYSVAELDSIHFSLPKKERISMFEYYETKFSLFIEEKSIDPTYGQRVSNFISDNFSKVLFIYMPVFAFLLWLFHNKRKWYYFDNGVFTLHYFSFILLIATLLVILEPIFMLWKCGEDIYDILFLIALLYIFFYFFRSHSNFYGERKAISRLKVTALLIINSILFLVVLAIFLLLAISW